MISAATTDSIRGYQTLVSEWLRAVIEENRRPSTTVWFEGQRQDACDVYRQVLNRFILTGLLLNAKPGRTGGQLRTEPMVEDVGGRNVDEHSANSETQANRKAKKGI